jgi:hypothetical protein
MSRGYLILAQNTKGTDYLRMAYALALSIKNSQSTVTSVSLATTDDVDRSYYDVFDNILDVPWTDHAEMSKWKIENKWKYYHITPYDETVILDADMLFPQDISHWWDILSTREIWITDKPRTFRGEIITSRQYRQTFEPNNLPNVYTAFMYFKKTQLSAELFKMIEIIFNNRERFFYDYLDETRPKHLSGDVAYALAIRLLGIESECFCKSEYLPTFVHMKSQLQNIREDLIHEDWTQSIPTYFAQDGTFKIGNYEQHLPFHYNTKTWLTDNMINTLKKRVGI